MTKKLLLLAAAAGIALPAMASFELNYPSDSKITKTFTPARALNSISLGDQSADVNQADDKLLYHDLTASAIFTAEPATVVQPAMNWSGKWMNGYLYIDLNGDGSFDPTELVSATYLNGHDSAGLTVAENSAAVAGQAGKLPPFVLPALKAGDYRMRYIIDWNSNDPKGSVSAGNDIITNGGAIADATLRITSDAPAAEKGNYPINVAADAQSTHADKPVRHLISFNLTSATLGEQTVPVGQETDNLIYHDKTDVIITALHGEKQTLNLNWTSDRWLNSYLYIDRDNNGNFEAQVAPDGKAISGSDLIAFSNYNNVGSDGSTSENGNVVPLPSFFIPESLPAGNYRARLKLDWNNIDPAGSLPVDGVNNAKGIQAFGGAIVDFTINVADEVRRVGVNIQPLNCLVMTAGGSIVKGLQIAGNDLGLKVIPVVEGFSGDKIIVRHGEGDEMTDTELELNADGTVTIPGDIINSDITIYALFEEQEGSEWTKVWGDEFNSDQMNSQCWSYHPRWGSNTWNRFIAETTDAQTRVNHFEEGCYKAYAIANNDFQSGADNGKEMVSGAIYSAGKFTFHYGRAEARVKTTPHTGNFPAFWLMPASNNEGGWPNSGEIDIWEQINAANQAHSTIHSAWGNATKGTPSQASPTKTHAQNADMNEWHVYALEWDEEELRFYVDGVHHFTYPNKHFSDAKYSEKESWPFYKNFYIILNQSVGKGDWAANPDKSFEYMTRFDYVRVYKKKGDEKNMTKTLNGNGDDPDFYVSLIPEENPDPENPDIENPDPENPDPENPDPENPDPENPDPENPVPENPDPVNPDPVNPDPENPTSIESVEATSASSAIFFDMNGRRVASPAKGGVYVRKAGNKISKVIL